MAIINFFPIQEERINGIKFGYNYQYNYKKVRTIAIIIRLFGKIYVRENCSHSFVFLCQGGCDGAMFCYGVSYDFIETTR